MPRLDTGPVPDTDFSRTVRAAQAGDEAAFVRLWRDANPLLVRYLRVVGYDDPYDGACEAWITVVRGLPEFTGDDADWLVWLLSCARLRAHEGSLRRAWGSVVVTPGVGLPVGAPQGHGVEDDLAGAAVEDPRTRGVADSLAALRSLPLGQGEVLVLRYGAGLSLRDTARVTGVDESTAHRLAQRGLERLGVDPDLLRWSLTAPRSVAELADERVVVGAFSSHRGTGRRAGHRPRGGGRGRHSRPGTARPGARVIATVTMPGAATGAGRGAPVSAASRGASAKRGASARGAATVATRSRGAALALGVVAASVMSLGGLSAAAYVGVLPAPVQQAMHDAIGAPAPQRAAGSSSSTSSSRRTPGGRATAPGGGPSAAAVAGLCRAWSADRAAGTPRDRSTAFRDLAGRAGGADQVTAYCAAAAAQPTSAADPTHPTGPRPTGPRPTQPGSPPSRTANPQSTAPGKGTTRTPGPHSTTRPASKPGTGTTKTSTQPGGSGKGATKGSNQQSPSSGSGAATPPRATGATGTGDGTGSDSGTGSSGGTRSAPDAGSGTGAGGAAAADRAAPTAPSSGR